jgi:hypothetical protein
MFKDVDVIPNSNQQFNCSGNVWIIPYVINGESGELGGNGGKGGYGGKQGLNGNMRIYELNNSEKVTITARKSEYFTNLNTGINGRPGQAGQGGLMGQLAYRQYWKCVPDKATRLIIGILTLGIHEFYIRVKEYKLDDLGDEFRPYFRQYDQLLPVIRAESGCVFNDLNERGLNEPKKFLDMSNYVIKTKYLLFYHNSIAHFTQKQIFDKKFLLTLYENEKIHDLTLDLNNVIERIKKLSMFNDALPSLEAELLNSINKHFNSNQEENVLYTLLAWIKSVKLGQRNVIPNHSNIKSLLISTIEQIETLNQLDVKKLLKIYITNYEGYLGKRIQDMSLEFVDMNYLHSCLSQLDSQRDRISYEILNIEDQNLLLNSINELFKLNKEKQIVQLLSMVINFVKFIHEKSVNSAELTKRVLNDNKQVLDLNFDEFAKYYDSFRSKLEIAIEMVQEMDKYIDKEIKLEDFDSIRTQVNSSMFLYDDYVNESKNFIFEILNNTESRFQGKLEQKKDKLNFNKDLEELQSKISLLISKNSSISYYSKEIFGNLNNNLQSLIEINELIRALSDKTDLVYYLAQINTNTNYPQGYSEKVNELKNQIHFNVLRDLYSNAIESFQEWYFPFKANQSIEINSFDISNVIASMKSNFNRLLSIVEDKTDPNQQHLITKVFDKENPFFKWSFGQNEYQLRKLLLGETTLFYSDVKQNLKYNMLKFTKVFIRIESENYTLNSILNDKMSELGINVELTHSGRSYFKYDEDYFPTNTNYYDGKILTLKYRYNCEISELNANKEECVSSSNELVKSLAENKPFLSPYTHWSMKLSVDIEKLVLIELPDEMILSSLSAYDLYLCGEGQFVSNDFVNHIK